MSAHGSAEADPEAADEATPLVSASSPRRRSRLQEHRESQPEVRFSCMEPAESIYGFMTVYPELHRVRAGGYCNGKVGVAFALIFLNITLQVSLTMIAGGSIFDDMQQYKTSLTQTGERSHDFLSDTLEEVDDYVHIPGLVGDTKEEACCAGDECANMGIPCCETKHAAVNRTVFVQARKPAGKAKGKKDAKEQDKGRALCFDGPGGLDCSPPTYAFTDHWKDLDVNKDGIWSIEEAKADENNLGCKLGVPVNEVFRSVISGSRKFANEIAQRAIAPEVAARTSVPFDYFQRWRGMVAMCAAVDHNRCTGLITDGVFDGALKMANIAPRDGITTLESALDYCYEMLKPGGVCDKALPVTYMMYRQQVADKCGLPTFSNGIMYTNPYDKSDVMRMVELSYPKLDKYTMAESYIFQFFVVLILLVWYVNLLGELSAIIHLADFSWNFPGAEDKDPWHLRKLARRVVSRAGRVAQHMRGQEEEPQVSARTPRERDETATTIKDISEAHRAVCFLVVLLRLWLLMYMASVGTVFALSTYSYPDLLMNAVALAFVFELPEFLFMLLVRGEDKRDLAEVGSLVYKTSIPEYQGILGQVFSVYFWGLIVFPMVGVTQVYMHLQHDITPIYEALRCSCLQSGPRCITEQRLQREWWNTQWAGLQPLF